MGTVASDKGKRTVTWLAGGCLGIVLVLLVGCGAMWVMGSRYRADYEKVVGGSDVDAAVTRLLEEYAKEVGEGDIADQYERFTTTRYRSEHPVGEFETANANVVLVGNLGVTVGAIQSGESTASASMDVACNNGIPSTIDFTLAREDGLWKVDGFALRP